MVKLAVSLVVGAALGVVRSRYLFAGSCSSLLPWAIVGLALGYWGNRREAIVDGSLYGFVLTFVFFVSAYSGSASLASRVPLLTILGVLGGVCGCALGLLGFLLKGKVQRGRNRAA